MLFYFFSFGVFISLLVIMSFTMGDQFVFDELFW